MTGIDSDKDVAKTERLRKLNAARDPGLERWDQLLDYGNGTRLDHFFERFEINERLLSKSTWNDFGIEIRSQNENKIIFSIFEQHV